LNDAELFDAFRLKSIGKAWFVVIYLTVEVSGLNNMSKFLSDRKALNPASVHAVKVKCHRKTYENINAKSWL
jgi:hypothetical protein